MQIYNNRPQFTIHKLRRVQDHEVDFAISFPPRSRDPEAMWRELRGIVGGVDNATYPRAVGRVSGRPGNRRALRMAPGRQDDSPCISERPARARASAVKLAKMVGGHYRQVDLDLLIAGVVLHDIGKIHELSYDRGFGYSAEGQLVGHIAIAIRMLARKLRAFPDFPLSCAI